MARKKARQKTVFSAPWKFTDRFLQLVSKRVLLTVQTRHENAKNWHLTLITLNIPHTCLQHLLSQLCWSSWVFVISFPCNYNVFDDLVANMSAVKVSHLLASTSYLCPFVTLFPRGHCHLSQLALTWHEANLSQFYDETAGHHIHWKTSIVSISVFYFVQDTVAGAPAPERKK